MVVELYYFADCPSWERALENLDEAMRLEGVAVPIQRVLVPSAADVARSRFLGSPTIRIDGVDLEGPDADERPFVFGCRLYPEADQARGWPSVEMIQRALQGAQG